MSTKTSSMESLEKGNVKVVVADVPLKSVLSPDGQKVFINENDADEALEYALKIGELDIDPQVERKLVRKIDWYLMPIIAALMSCQLMDKTTNSYASIMGLRQDLNMVEGQVYSWVGSSFYFGYLIFQFPANYLLQRFPLSKTLGFAVFIWGVILCCHAACHSAAPFLVCRVLLGVFEGFMNPAYVLITSQWYKKEEQFIRTCIWFGFQGFGTLLGASIAYGLAIHSESYSIPAWRLLYVVTGLITIVLALISIFHVPDIPVKAWFLNEEEKTYVVERIRGNNQGFGNSHFKKHQMFEAFKDLRTWILFLYGMIYAIPNGGFTNFGSILLNQDFGFSSTGALLMGMPGGAIDIVVPVTVAYFGHKLCKSRLLNCLAVNAFVFVGICLLAFTQPKGSRLFGYLTFYVATGVISGMLSCISSNTAGRTKKSTVNTIFLIGYCVGNIIGPQTFRTNQAPSYTGAKIAMVVSFGTAEILILLMYLLNLFENKRRDKLREELGDSYVKPENIEFADLTDKENPEFRYML